MSRVGRQPIGVPSGVQVEFEGSSLRVKGPKGELRRNIHPDLTVRVEDDTILVERPDDHRERRSLHGLTRTLIANMVHGVTQGYEKRLVLEGVGYRASMQGKILVLGIGYSHPVEFEPPDGIEIEVPQPNTVVIRGIDKELVGNIAAAIRAKRPLSRYRYADGPRGIRYADERISLKPVKGGK